MSELEGKVINRLHELVGEDKLSNECLVQIIELCGMYINLKTISVYSK